MDIKGIISDVKFNCNVSDAKFWGHYSICGLLLRMRELYKNEKGLMPWETIPSEDMTTWIGEREALWRELEDKDFQPINIDGKRYSPFDVESINGILNPRGLLYGGGYGTLGKPTFFISRLIKKTEILDYNLYYAGEELCRDLSTSMAMLQGICIFVRTEAIRLILWEKVSEMRARRFKGLLDRAFADYNIGKGTPNGLDLYERLGEITDDIKDLFVYHEVGEAVEDSYGIQWEGLSFSDRWLELHLRGIKDILADTSYKGPLKFIIDKRDERLLIFYLIFLDGIRKTLFPEIMNSYQNFLDKPDWKLIESARNKGYERAKSIIEGLSIMIKDKETSPNLKVFIKKYLEDALRGLMIN